MRKCILAVIILLQAVALNAQELFVFTEPASNMPAHTIGIRATNLMMAEANGTINYHLIPEIMWGVNQRLMFHVESFFSNRNTGFGWEGVGLYAKYRLYTRDTLYRHFRLAAYGRATTNNTPVHQEAIMTNAHNTGFELGFIGTKLLHKQAISASLSYEHALGNLGGNEYPAGQSANAINMSLSTGRLFYPRHYQNYKQTNINGMLELLGQVLPESSQEFLDIAPSIQFIVNSQARIDIGYRQQLYSNMIRTAPNGLLIRFEYLFFDLLP